MSLVYMLEGDNGASELLAPCDHTLFCYCCLLADENKPSFGFCDWALTALSWLLVVMTFPMSLCVCMKVVSFWFFLINVL